MERKLPGRIRQAAAWLPFRWDTEDGLPKAAAIQAVVEGKATPDQQILAMKAIVHDICELEGLSYSPDDARDTDFAEGKRFVAIEIGKLARLNYSKLAPNKDGNRPSPRGRGNG